MTAIAEMAEIIGRHTSGDGIHKSALPRLTLFKSSKLTDPIHNVYSPTLCLVAQGAKRALLGDRAYVYDPAKFLIVSVDLPVVASVIEASPERPYLCAALDLDIPAIAALLVDQDVRPAPTDGSVPAIGLSEVEPPLQDAMVRLLRLLDSPEDAAVLAPLAEREILYRLLMSGQGAMMRHIAAGESRLRQISRAIAWIRVNYAEACRVDRLAAEAGMSPSSFHHHFKAVTSMSPLQYRTQLRLQEARRLMVSEGLEAASAGFRVGYESPSQFSRDYSRTFGAPPSKDAARLRTTPEYALVA